MLCQKTLKDVIVLKGREPYGGNNVDVVVSPVSPDKGLFFRSLKTPKEVKHFNVKLVGNKRSYGINRKYERRKARR